ncbi:MAG: mechanosensitive ion channel family protein [Spirulina sp.]
MQRLKFRALIVMSLLLLMPALAMGMYDVSPVSAQLALPQPLENTLPTISTSKSETETAIAWIRLDGKPIFPITSVKNELPERVRNVQKNLRNIKNNYLEGQDADLKIEVRTDRSLPTLYINDRYLFTITHLDARLQGSEHQTYAETLKTTLMEAFQTARAERQPEYVRKQTQWAIAIAIGVMLISLALNLLPAQFARSPSSPESVDALPLTTRLNLRQYRNLSAIGRLFRQLAQLALWTTGILLILSLFPQTRIWQVLILGRLKSYLAFVVILVFTYISIRLSYILIARSLAAFVESAELIPRRSTQRLQQRVSTISSVTKSISTILLSIVGIFLALVSLGVNIAPLLAGAGLIGVAISLASQNLIKDAINGFLILVEDQYAVGDVIAVGNVTGFVENITLRITQLRDTEQRLITIPNSEIKIVSNLSSRHAQADIKIPFSYGVDIDEALRLVERVGDDLAGDPDWQEFILEKPQILGLDEFSNRGTIVRIWIKTQPLKQWDVGREFRRRLKRACDRAKMPIALDRQEIWLHDKTEKESSD